MSDAPKTNAQWERAYRQKRDNLISRRQSATGESREKAAKHVERWAESEYRKRNG